MGDGCVVLIIGLLLHASQGDARWIEISEKEKYSGVLFTPQVLAALATTRLLYSILSR